MNDRDCPIGDCAGTVRFDDAVVEIAPRFQLHDLGDVDEFVACSDCGAEVAGFHEDPGDGEGDPGVELILDIDDDAEDDTTDSTAAGTAAGSDADADAADDAAEDAGSWDETGDARSGDEAGEAESDDEAGGGGSDDEAGDAESDGEVFEFGNDFSQATDAFDDPADVLDQADADVDAVAEDDGST